MNFMMILGLLPTILEAVNLARQIQSDIKGDKSIEGIVKTVQDRSPAVLDIFQKVGGALFPNLQQPQQVAAATVTFDPSLVKRIQAALNAQGSTLSVDGYYGPATKAAVKGFQVKNGLEPDGWAGPLTQAKLLPSK